MIESLLNLLRCDDETTIRLAFDILNKQEISLSDKIEYLNASNYRMGIDLLNQYFDRPSNRLYFINNLGTIKSLIWAMNIIFQIKNRQRKFSFT